jgi:hypothetical protein
LSSIAATACPEPPAPRRTNPACNGEHSAGLIARSSDDARGAHFTQVNEEFSPRPTAYALASGSLLLGGQRQPKMVDYRDAS